MEKGTIEGVKSYYQDMNAFFKKRLSDIKIPTIEVPRCDCDTLITNGHSLVFDKIVEGKLEQIWKDLYAISGNRGLAHYISKEPHWKDLKFSEWNQNISENDLKPMDSVGRDLDFKSLKVGISRYCSYGVVVNHKVAGSKYFNSSKDGEICWTANCNSH